MLGSTAFVFGEDSRLQRERTINLSLQGRHIARPKTYYDHVKNFFLSNVYITCATLYALWVGVGLTFYTYYSDWTPATAYYYAMEAGLSIGFCNPVEKDDWSKLFTIFYVLVGSTIVSGSVGLIASSLVLHTSPILSVKREDILKKMKQKFNISEHLYYSPHLENNATIMDYLRYIWYHLKYYFGWYSNRFRAIITVVFILWMAFGTIYGMVVEKWTFITSLYWAITTASTGGLQSAECISNTTGTNCNMGNFRGSMMGFFMMVGVPIYAVAFGQYARLVISKTVQYQEEKLLNRPIEDAEFIFAANILSPEGSETLVLGEYILLELMRLGITNKRQIENMKEKFLELDTLNRGELDIDDLRKEGKVVESKSKKLMSKEVLLDI